MSAPYSIGQRIELKDGRVASIRFVGTTTFQTGDWIGVELEEATGKNDGSVKGERYFDCEQGYGMFLRPTGVQQVLEDVKATAKATGNGVPGKSKAAAATRANGLKRQSILGGAERRTSAIQGTPTPGARAALSGIRSPVKSPTKQLGSNGMSSTSTSRTNTPPVGKKAPAAAASGKPTQSLQPPATAASRRTTVMSTPAAASTSSRTSKTSLALPLAGNKAPAARSAPNATTAAQAPSPVAYIQQRLSSTTEEDTSEDGSEQPDYFAHKEPDTPSEAGNNEANGEQEDADDTIRPNFAPPPIPPNPPKASPNFSRPRRPSSPAAASIHSQKTIRSTTASNRQIEELEAKVRLLERKRVEDRDVKKSLEQAQHERDQYKGIIEKLQTKYRPQQQEIATLKQTLSEAEKKATALEKTQAEHDSVVEMATLDREMAEETAESLKTELEALRAHNEEVQLEIEILKEENTDLTKEMSPEEREGAGWMQLQHSNDRLRNALLALRDRALDEKEELKERMQSLEEQVKDLDSLRGQHEETREKLLRSEADTDDLRQQLELALQADEMIEALTERNGRLEAAVDEMKVTIEDLENLKELNDELEINHVEAEKQMQEEIDFKESLLLDRERTTKLQQEGLDSKDDTIRQFRSLVSDLQAGMADMKASKQITESEAKHLEGKSRAMLDLNLKLQTSAAKTQVKAIDLELRKLDAQEASEHLEIVQLFMPEAFHVERDSVLALLRFKRIGFKAELVHGFVKDRVATFGTRGMEEQVFAACDVLDKLTWVAAMADRFINAASSCSVEDFPSFKSTLFELEPVERALNGYIDALRRDEINERDIAEELQRSIAVMSHLASLHIKSDLASHADDLVMRTRCLQSQLESVATALQLSRTMIENHVPKFSDDDEDDEGSASDLAIILNRADTLMNHARSAKVTAGKAYRDLSDLQERSLALEMKYSDDFQSTEDVAARISEYARQAGDALQSVFSEEGRDQPFAPSDVSDILSRVAVPVFSLQAPESGPFNALAKRLRELTESLSDIAALPNDLDNTVEFERGPEPWVARANELKQTKLTSLDTEAELARTLESLRGKDIVIKDKETELEEQSVRIEMYEARMKDASKRSARIGELEKALHEAKDAERKAKREMDRATEEKNKEVDRAREEMGRLGSAAKQAGAGAQLDDGAIGAATKLTLDRQSHKISSLESAVRYLKSENHLLRLPPPDSPLSAQATLSWLHEPLIPPRTDRRKRQENLQKEGRDVLQKMLSMASEARGVDLTKMAEKENKLAWRPAKESSRWKVEKGKEEWERLKGWRREIVRAGGREGGSAGHAMDPVNGAKGGVVV